MHSGFSPARFWVLFCSVCSAADTHLKLLDCAVIGARFLTGDVFEYDIAHRRSVTVLCMLYKIRCITTHFLNGALPGLYVPVWVTRGALVAHRYTYAPPHCRTSQYRRTFYSPIKVSLERSCWPCIRRCGTGGFQEQGQCFFIGLSCSISIGSIFHYFPFLFLWVGFVRVGSSDW